MRAVNHRATIRWRAAGQSRCISAVCAGLFATCLIVIGAFAFAHLALPQSAWAEGEAENLVDPTQRADNSFIYDTTIGSLFSQSSLYEGRTVQVVGEVIGDCITASDGNDLYWITLSSAEEEDQSSISVLISKDQVNQIDHYGRYGVVGTIFQVRGTYHQACADHDGLPDIHATNSSVMKRGEDRPDEFSLNEFAPGILALIGGLALMGGFYLARERMR